MARHQRLSALDAMFLGIESENLHMHVGGVFIFDAEPLKTPDGGIDFYRIREYTDAILTRHPRYRQRLKEVPGLRHPVWVDDEHFDIAFHLRHSALPRPGTERLLKRLAGRIFSQRLDRTRPLWEIWVVEGLEGNRFALIAKVHHAMIDGVAGVELMASLLRGTPDASLPEPVEWRPEPAPTGMDLLTRELKHRASGLRSAIERGRAAWAELGREGTAARHRAEGALRLLSSGLKPAPATPINPRTVSPYRRFDVCRFDLQEIKSVKNALGGKVNDVVLAITAGALHRYLDRKNVAARGLSGFRILMPVNIRDQSAHGSDGNRVALTLLELPVEIADPEARYQRILEATGQAKGESHQIEGAAFLEELSDITSDAVMRDAVRLAGALRAFNVTITNVPGPPFPLYLLGARLSEVFPLVPLFSQQAIGVALFSYSGGVYIGLNSDWHAIPDLHELVADFDESFAELVMIAGDRGRIVDEEAPVTRSPKTAAPATRSGTSAVPQPSADS